VHRSVRGLAFEPALEGLRGFALLGMLCFHSGFWWAAGGFLPIATFFTLSGYLITSLFLVEWEQTGRIRLGRFWGRRFRRLMPAALVTLAAMSIFAVFLATPHQLARLRADVIWALFYMANWHFIITEAAYHQLFFTPSPVQHFWSLAIEEQFYFAYPLVAVLGLRLGRGSRTGLGVLLVALTVASVFVSVWLMHAGASIDRVYYGSDARAAELLMGGVLAVALQGRQVLGGFRRGVAELLGLFSLGFMLYLWHSATLADRWLYLGGFAAYSFLSLAVIIAAVQPAGFVRGFLSTPPMRWIGRVSYGAYLFHWPVFLWLTAARTGLGTVALLALRLVVTFGLAELSYRFVESPIRERRALRGWRTLVATPAAFAAVAIAITLGVGTPTEGDGLDEASVAMLALNRQQMEFAVNPTDMDEPPGLGKALPRVATFGDSTALPVRDALNLWVHKENRGRPRPGVGQLGCGLLREGTSRSLGRERSQPNHCRDPEDLWAEKLAEGRPDIAVVILGPWDVCDHRLPGDDVWRAPGDPVLDARLQDEMLAAVDLLSSDGALVVWLLHPAIEARRNGEVPEVPFPESDPARMTRFNELISELEELRPGKVRVVDLPRHMRTHPGGEIDPAYRPDGTHLSPRAGRKLVDEWLGEEVLRVYREESERAVAHESNRGNGPAADPPG